MSKIKLTIEYDGTNFVGWQKQKNGISIQSCIEEAIKKLTSKETTLFGAGRTDAGVHAKGQVAHFELTKSLSLDNIRDGLNQYLRKKSISILRAEEVEKNFDARFSAKLRSYQYNKILLQNYENRKLSRGTVSGQNSSPLRLGGPVPYHGAK